MKSLVIGAATEMATESPAAAVLSEAIRVSAIGMLGIFVVMGLFALMIILLTRVFPDGRDKS